MIVPKKSLINLHDSYLKSTKPEKMFERKKKIKQHSLKPCNSNLATKYRRSQRDFIKNNTGVYKLEAGKISKPTPGVSEQNLFDKNPPCNTRYLFKHLVPSG